MSKIKKIYDPETDYTQKENEAIELGDIYGAINAEKMHNAKDSDMELGYGARGTWNYQDSSGLGGLKERKFNEIENYFSTPFDYDYRDDKQYKAIRNLKEKEAKKAYDDGYAALSTQFEGGVPVNMMNKLHETSNSIIDSADSYIPTLYNMAREMYLGKGNQLINQYGILSDMENQQYNRWADNRDFAGRAAMDAYSLNTDRERYADDKSWREKTFENENAWRQADYDMQDKYYYLSRDDQNHGQEMDKLYYNAAREDRGFDEDMMLKQYELDKYRAYK